MHGLQVDWPIYFSSLLFFYPLPLSPIFVCVTRRFCTTIPQRLAQRMHASLCLFFFHHCFCPCHAFLYVMLPVGRTEFKRDQGMDGFKVPGGRKSTGARSWRRQAFAVLMAMNEKGRK